MVADCSPPKLLLAVLESDAVATTYVMRLDADLFVGHDLANAIAAAKEDKADLCSVNVHAHNRRQNMCTRFQALEYDMAMLARHYRPWLISGAGVVARTVMLREILRRHSMSPIGEDIEMGRVAFAGKLRIRHLDVVIETDVPDAWQALFRQRRLWWAGNSPRLVRQLRPQRVPASLVVAVQHRDLLDDDPPARVELRILLLHPSITFFAFAGLLIVTASATTLVASWKVRTPLMAIFPFYAVVQSSLIFSVGAFWYLRLLPKSRNFGRYRFGLRRRTFEIDPPTHGSASVAPGAVLRTTGDGTWALPDIEPV